MLVGKSEALDTIAAALEVLATEAPPLSDLAAA